MYEIKSFLVFFYEDTATDRESAVLEHVKKSGHSVSFEDVRVLASEPHYHQCKVREAVKIFKRRPSLNRDQGYEVAPILHLRSKAGF